MCLLMAPFFPHLSEEVWSRRGYAGSVHLQSWPGFDSAKVQKERINIVVQVNGKMRAMLEVDAGLSDSRLQEKALAHSNVQTHLADRPVRRAIVVPDKLVNLVV